MPSLLIAALLLAANPVAVELPTERVDLIELEHVLEAGGGVRMHQILARDWEESTGLYEIRDWMTVEDKSDFPKMTPEGEAVVVWRKGGKSRIVIAKEFMETRHRMDIEIHERKRWDKRRPIGENPPPVIPPEPGSDPLPPAPEER